MSSMALLLLLAACLQLRFATVHAQEPTLLLSDERVVFMTKHGDFEFAFLPEVGLVCSHRCTKSITASTHCCRPLLGPSCPP